MCERSKDEVIDAQEQGKRNEKSYYYDDAHGYEDFDPKEEAAEEDDELA